MTTETTVRRYRAAERDDVWRVHDRALRESELDFSPEYNRYLRHVESEFLDPGGEFLVVVAGDDGRDAADGASPGRVVAIGGYQPLSYISETRSGDLPPFAVESPGATARVRSVAVLPDRQSRGVGTDLMDELESRAAAANLTRLVLKTGAELRQAKRFYASRGYVPVQRSDGGSETCYAWYEKCL